MKVFISIVTLVLVFAHVEKTTQFNNGRPSVEIPKDKCTVSQWAQEKQGDRQLNYLEGQFQTFKSAFNSKRPRVPMRDDDFPMWAYTKGFNTKVNPVIQRFYSYGKLNSYKCYIAEMLNKVERLSSLCVRGERSSARYDNLKVGDNLYSDQFKSCSINNNKRTPGQFCSKNGGGAFFFINSNKGIRAMEKSAFPQQDEFIIPPGLSFTVTEIVRDFKPGREFGNDCQKPGNKYDKIVLNIV